MSCRDYWSNETGGFTSGFQHNCQI
jgi:hypothetical protein